MSIDLDLEIPVLVEEEVVDFQSHIRYLFGGLAGSLDSAGWLDLADMPDGGGNSPALN